MKKLFTSGGPIAALIFFFVSSASGYTVSVCPAFDSHAECHSLESNKVAEFVTKYYGPNAKLELCTQKTTFHNCQILRAGEIKAPEVQICHMARVCDSPVLCESAHLEEKCECINLPGGKCPEAKPSPNTPQSVSPVQPNIS